MRSIVSDPASKHLRIWDFANASGSMGLVDMGGRSSPALRLIARDSFTEVLFFGDFCVGALKLANRRWRRGEACSETVSDGTAVSLSKLLSLGSHTPLSMFRCISVFCIGSSWFHHVPNRYFLLRREVV